MLNLGTIRPGRTIYIGFESFASSTGAPITMTNFAAADIQVFKDGSMTQRASTSGFTLLDTDGVDIDSITGLHGFSIDLSDNTTAGFWAAGSTYLVAVSTVTVDSQTMSFWAAHFRIGYDAAVLNTTIATLSTQTSFTLTTGPAEDDALNGSIVIIHDVASNVQQTYAVVADYTGSTKTITLAAAGTFTVAASDNISFFPPALTATTAGRTLDVSAGGEAGVDWANVGSPTTTLNLSGTSTKAVEPTVAGRTLDVSAGGEAGVDWANVGSPTTSLALTGTTIATTQKVDLETIKTNPVVNAGTVTFPTTATLASTTNITAGTVTTATNVTTVSTGAISAGSFAAGAIDAAAIATGAIDADAIAADAIGSSELAASAVTEIQSGLATAASISALNNISAADILTTALTESYATDGSAFTLSQALYMLWSALAEFSISSTTITAKKLDGTTTSMTFTLDSATAPTSRTRTT